MIIEGDDVQKKVREAFGLDDNVKIVFQAYNDEWSEWCDIEGAEIHFPITGRDIVALPRSHDRILVIKMQSLKRNTEKMLNLS